MSYAYASRRLEPEGYVRPDGTLPQQPTAAPVAPLMVLVPYDPAVNGLLLTAAPATARPAPAPLPFPPGYGPAEQTAADERSQASMAHWLSVLIGVIAPLLFVGSDRPFVRHHAKQSLNVSLTALAIWAILAPLLLLGSLVIGVGAVFALVILFIAPAIWVYEFVAHVACAAQAGTGSSAKAPAFGFLR